MPPLIPMSEVGKHNTRDDCWVVLNGKVYNLTPFLEDHPAGARIILQQAGKDGTAAFEPFHPVDIVERLGLYDKLYVGDVDPATVTAVATTAPPQPATAKDSSFKKPPLSHFLNLFDFEAVAQRVMGAKGWDYYSSGADDEFTLRENRAAFQRVWLRPRVLVDVSTIDMSSTIFGCPTSIPVYITATALGKLAHPDGEVALTRAAATTGVIQMMPTLSSCTLSEMLAAKAPGQTQFFQLYVNSDRGVTERLVRQAEDGGAKAMCVTVDAPCLGRREKDMRHKFSSSYSLEDDKVTRGAGAARAISTFIDPSLSWKDLPWLRSITNMKLVLKGIQCGEDAVMAARHGVDGIVVSNHGGRQLDLSRSGVEVLVEVMDALRAAGLHNTMEVLMDGGVRRGADVYKALALGATAVGIGRPALYGLASHGQAGVERVIDILKDELEMTMRLMGAPTVADIKPEHLAHSSLATHTTPAPTDFLATSTYVPLRAKL